MAHFYYDQKASKWLISILANTALVELKEIVDAQEQPKKGIVNFLKSLVRRAVENPIAVAKGTNVLLDEGQKAIDTLQSLLPPSPPPGLG